ncbi:MAG TPA: isoprenylcysteine carboxylmethyltransferase family protein [Bacteroidota bacterium]|nr:isoprenylcysteine carboxylmethyltransferase family protein [Bacteroidota bacterium]
MTHTKLVVRLFASSIMFSVILFVCAGRADYAQGWIYFFTNLFASAMHLVVVRKNPELIAERSRPGEGIKTWDKVLLGLSTVILFANVILAGLDTGRYHWSPQAPWSVSVAGVIFTLTGQRIFLAALKENKFFSTVVRIQKERGHTVCDTGPYRVVRHPGYIGMIVSLAGVPMMLGSAASAVLTLIAIIVLIVRTSLEDRTLKQELEGYLKYTETTRFKLVPGIW